MVSDIVVRLNHRDVDNGGVEIYPSDYPLKYISDSVTDTDTTLIKSIYYD